MLLSMGLFGNKADKQAKTAVAEAESQRLLALSLPELAAEVMPAFGPVGINATEVMSDQTSAISYGSGTVVAFTRGHPNSPKAYRSPR